MDKQYTFQDFRDIVATLRSENGCPWDKEQTHESLKPCMMEEAAELVSAIRIYDQTGYADNMREELGDILLQVVMHSQIAKEENLFTLDDVIQEIGEKMVRRHPHVFGDVLADTSEEVLRNWDEIKKREKEGKEWIPSPLQEIPKELPALTRAPKVLKKVDKLYEKQEDANSAVNAMAQEIDKLKIAVDTDNKEEVQDEIGNLLMQVAQLGRIYKIPLEQVLTDKVEDMIEKFEGNAENVVKSR